MEIICRNLKRGHIMSWLRVCLFLVVVVSCCHGEGNLKDITFARPKHLRYPSYKSLQENTTNSEKRDHLESQESQKIQTNTTRGGKSDEPPSSNVKRALPKVHHTGDPLASPRYGGSPLSLQKTPPDLQFGLAFTVPFVSLSTDKLINTFSGKSHNGNDVSSILKLNIKGLIVAAVVGVAAFLFLPGLLSGGGFPGLLGGSGWGSGGLLDSILPQVSSIFPGLLDHLGGGHHGSGGYSDSGWNQEGQGGRPFGYQDYYEYNGVHNHNRMDAQGLLREKSGRREARSGTNSTINTDQLLKNLLKTVSSQAKKYVSQAEGCLHLQVCRKAVAVGKEKSGEKSRGGKKEEEDLDWIGLVESITDNELVKGSPLSEGVKKAHQYGAKEGHCKVFEKSQCGI